MVQARVVQRMESANHWITHAIIGLISPNTQWIMIYSVDYSAIQRLKNRGQILMTINLAT